MTHHGLADDKDLQSWYTQALNADQNAGMCTKCGNLASAESYRQMSRIAWDNFFSRKKALEKKNRNVSIVA